MHQYAPTTELKSISHFRPFSLSLGIFHDKYRAKNPRDLSNYDVVVTTYATLMADWTAKGRKVLQSIAWFRVVLDEGTATITSHHDLHDYKLMD